MMQSQFSVNEMEARFSLGSAQWIIDDVPYVNVSMRIEALIELISRIHRIFRRGLNCENEKHFCADCVKVRG